MANARSTGWVHVVYGLTEEVVLGRRSSEEAENHWPGFVDALSTIVMVVTFLLIILSIAIFAISQQVAKSFIESEAERTAQGGGDVWSAEAKLASSDKRPDQPSPETKPQPTQSKSEQNKLQSTQTQDQNQSAENKSKNDNETSSAAKKLATDDFQLKLAERLTQNELVNTETKFTIRSRKVAVDETQVVVPSDELAKGDKKPISVESAQSILTLQFDDLTTKIDDDTGSVVTSFLDEQKAKLDEGKIVIWSFAHSIVGSVSEAKRLAYYRALSVRNEIVKAGKPPEQITVQVRIAKKDDEANLVKIVVQP